MDAILTIGLILSLLLHTSWLDSYRHEEHTRRAIWFRKDGFHYGWDYGMGCNSSRRLFRWPWAKS